ncbi:MAG TPA: Crp/Fnr family transcriptional regulator [Clostridiales bacterium]|nr:Crp/Fnr family transcriptional regulator [Clostridiales bacterium]
MNENMLQSQIGELKNAFPFIQDMDPDQLESLFQASKISDVEAGTPIINSGKECPGLALILRGCVKVSRISNEGREITIYRVKKGETCILSAVCMLGAGFSNYPVTVTTEQDSRMMLISTSYIRKAVTDNSPLWKYILTSIADRLYQAIDVVDKVAFQSVEKRLAQILLEFGGEGRHSVYATHEMLARELGTAREVISRQLKEFERQKLIQLKRGIITILQTDALKNLYETR